jgi:protein TonB
MSEIKYNKASWDDIVFEGLNQDYGSYVLRKIINRNTTRAFIITTVAFMAIMLIVKLKVFDKLVREQEKVVVVDLTEVELPPPPPPIEEAPPPPPPPPPPPLVRPTIQMVELIAKEDEKVADEKVTKQEEVKDVQISDKTIEGNKDAKASIIIPTDEGGKGPEPEPAKPKAPEILSRSEVMPSFPGGNVELFKYLNKNIRYPALARENGLEGKVTVTFYVDTDGSIKEPKVLKDGVGGGCAEEALRVIKAMPKWTPGANNGIPAKVWFTVPVSFVLN